MLIVLNQRRFGDTEVRLGTLIPDLVETFTLQVDPDKKSKCQTIQSIVETTVNLIVDTTIMIMTDGASQAFTAYLNKQMKKVEDNIARKWKATRFVRAIQVLEMTAVNELGDVLNNKISSSVRHQLNDLAKKETRAETKKAFRTLRALAKKKHGVEGMKEFTDYVRKGETVRNLFDEVRGHLQKNTIHQKMAQEYRRLEQEYVEKMARKMSQLHPSKAEQEAISKSLRQTSKDLEKIRKEAWKFDVSKLDGYLWKTLTRHFDYVEVPRFDDLAWPLSEGVASQFYQPFLHLPQNWANEYHPHRHGFADLSGPTTLVNAAYRAWPGNKLKAQYREQAEAGLRGGHAELPTIITGTGHGWLCSGYEGDWEDLNDPNIKLLQKRVNAELSNGRRQVWTLFNEMYQGATPEPGLPSMLARWLLARKWLGRDEPGTVEYELQHTEEFYR
jgi:hypothetical protein